jgi:hypothetical protein
MNNKKEIYPEKNLTKGISLEIIGDFTGVYIERYATCNDAKYKTLENFTYFEYIPLK